MHSGVRRGQTAGFLEASGWNHYSKMVFKPSPSNTTTIQQTLSNFPSLAGSAVAGVVGVQGSTGGEGGGGSTADRPGGFALERR